MTALTLLPDVTADASFSSCGTWRYTLTRDWSEGPRVLWIMLNPSVATAEDDDRTIRKCQKFARNWNYGGISVANIFALRSTDPKALYGHPDPVGPDNDATLAELATADSTLVVAAWGDHGVYRNRGLIVHERLIDAGVEVMCLGVTKRRQPVHPLYQRGDSQPVPYQP